jgi:hypothetical protein
MLNGLFTFRGLGGGPAGQGQGGSGQDAAAAPAESAVELA